MTTTTDALKLNMRLCLTFERAGVEFEIEVSGSESADIGPSFSLVAMAPEAGERLAFVSSVSPALADWVRGYTRWLYRARISASHTDDAIAGSFAAGLTAEQVLDGVSLACDMIRQRFDLYENSVVAG